MPVLEVKDVRKAYAKTVAVDGLSFDVDEGEIFALLGPNGAGKTTMVRMLLEIIRPDSGDIAWRLDGVSQRPDPSRLGYLPEERGLHKDVPVLRTLVYFGELHGMRRAEARRAAEAWLEKLELGDRGKGKLDALSKGNQQKIQFAAAVLHEPGFAVLDEPFSGFDPVNQERFIDIILDLRARGMTVLLSAHQMQLVERIADRILLIDRGRAVLAGTLESVRAAAAVQRRLLVDVEGEVHAPGIADCPGVIDFVQEGSRLELSLDGDQPLNPVIEAVSRAASVRGIQDARPTLHDIYVDAVRRRAKGVS